MNISAAEPRVRLIRCCDGFALSLQRDGQTYCIIFDDDTRKEALRTLGRWATSDMGFTMIDAYRVAAVMEGMKCESCR